MTAIMDLSFPGQRTVTPASCIPHDSVYMPVTCTRVFRHSSKHSSRGSKGSDKEGYGVASEDEDKTSPARAVSIAQNLGRFS